MLAEPRKKVRYSNNPCGNLWTKDTSTVGRQMLERLGWSPGTGLGRNNDGINEALKPSGRSDRRGLGKKLDYSLGSSQQLDDYAKLLKSLNKSYPTLKRSHSSASLEDISESSSNRLHYSKFIRAKDSSKYDEKALRVILGSTIDNHTTDLPSTDEAQRAAPTTQQSEIPDFGVKTVTSTMSMNDYFKQRMEAIKKTKILTSGVSTEGFSDSSSSSIPSKKSCHDVNITTVSPESSKIFRHQDLSNIVNGDNRVRDSISFDAEEQLNNITDDTFRAPVEHNSNSLNESPGKSSGHKKPPRHRAIGSSSFSQTNLLSLPGYQPY